ncbi:TetR/AcrR family transcriptional regulator [Methanobacterium subterraneum]|jgi:AcrR family transcriptional regulator|uniref:TetR/AcrR family transcriptional regulator n=1 Tax=Methanobacterium subterraneum TaxID=59277 RepID=A0A7K4DJ32_9EURY|nr:TetR/AcrR family transcriptional regulator [Methanobacterium subterraneum]MBW4258430.1 TetR/AcrR family transcriptional regulator [Methanobacterium sp. YSL]NMO08350.1 TetR/AcrR family transcriptional regulator [Methanobacterium subterraneum]
MEDEKSKDKIKPTKERIFDVSIELFAAKGFDAVSVREIARGVGIRESSIYNHYPSKNAILDDIFQYFEKELIKMRPPEAQNPAKLNELTLDVFRERVKRTLNILKTPKMAKIFQISSSEQFRDERAKKIILHTLIKEPQQFTEKVLEKMVENGTIKPVNPKILSVEFQYPLFSLFLEYLLLTSEDLDTSTVEEAISNHVDYFLDTIRGENRK